MPRRTQENITVRGRRMTEKPKEIGEHNRANPKLRDLYDELFDEEHPYR